jgi:hypothetical protein
MLPHFQLSWPFSRKTSKTKKYLKDKPVDKVDEGVRHGLSEKKFIHPGIIGQVASQLITTNAVENIRGANIPGHRPVVKNLFAPHVKVLAWFDAGDSSANLKRLASGISDSWPKRVTRSITRNFYESLT